MIYRQFNAPNVEYHEIDRSQYDLTSDNPAVGTITFTIGFADKGDDYDPKYSRSLADFLQTYGYPTNEAERYLYATAKEVFSKGGRIITSKIPYDNESKDKFAYTVYAAESGSDAVKALNDFELTKIGEIDDSITSAIEIKSVNNKNFFDYLSAINGNVDRSGLMTIEQYDDLLVGKAKPKENSFFIVDIARNRYSKDPNLRELSSNQTDSYLGYMPVVVSPWNALYFQNLLSVGESITLIEELPTDGSIDSETIVRKVNELISILKDASEHVSFNVVDSIQTIPNTGKIVIDGEEISKESDEENTYVQDQISEIEELLTDGSINLRDVVNKFNELIRYLNAQMNTFIDDGTSLSSMNNIPPLSVLSSNFAQQLAASDSVSETVSKIAAKFFPSIRFYSEKHLDKTYLKQIGIVVFKMVADQSNDGRINFTPVESFIGSLDRKAKDPISGKNIFIDNVVNEKSETINVFSNFNFQNVVQVAYNEDSGISEKQVVASPLEKASIIRITDQTATTLGFFVSQCSKFITNDVINSSLDLILENCKNPNTVPFDILCDGGISNIAQYMASLKDKTIFYEPEFDFNGDFAIKDFESTKVWKDILVKYDDFIKHGRKDCIFVADALRSFCLNGNEKIIRRSAPKNTIINVLVPKIRYMLPPNSSYSAGYCDWFRCVDDVTGDYFWCPPSIKAVGVYLYTDRYANVWDAPAGENRGKIEDAYDIAFNPTVEEAQYFYDQQWNYAMSFPMTGIVLEGQKTFQVEKTALDRVNVRRLCNGIKKGVREIARWFKYEGITPLVLTRFRDQLDEFLQKIKSRDGISEYFIKLDNENNTPETIDRNEIHAAFAIRPVKSAEWIIIQSVVVNQSANLEEVTNSVLA